MTSHTQTPPAAAVPGLSGKRVTFFVLLGLAVIGAGISYTLWTYSRLDVARKASAIAWRDLTEQLALRYRSAEKIVAQGVDSRQTKMEFGERFQLAVDRFRTIALLTDQYQAGLSVEELLGSEDFIAINMAVNGSRHLPQSDELKQAVEGFNQMRARERDLLDSFGGKMLDIVLKFVAPTPFELAH